MIPKDIIKYLQQNEERQFQEFMVGILENQQLKAKSINVHFDIEQDGSYLYIDYVVGLK